MGAKCEKYVSKNCEDFGVKGTFPDFDVFKIYIFYCKIEKKDYKYIKSEKKAKNSNKDHDSFIKFCNSKDKS